MVLVTSHSEPEDVADGLRRGAHDYLRKPFEQPELVARVHAAMRTKALRDELRARNAQLERLVSTDLLTGLLNRGATADHLRALVSRSQRHGAAAVGRPARRRRHRRGQRPPRPRGRRRTCSRPSPHGSAASCARRTTPGAGAATRCSSSRRTRRARSVGALVARLRGAVDARAGRPRRRGPGRQRVGRAPRHWAEGDDAEALVRRAERDAGGRADAAPPLRPGTRPLRGPPPIGGGRLPPAQASAGAMVHSRHAGAYFSVRPGGVMGGAAGPDFRNKASGEREMTQTLEGSSPAAGPHPRAARYGAS